MKRLALAVVLLQLVAAAVAGAQSLADVARKEEQRRKDVKKPAKVYTNKDLGQVDPAPPPPATPAAAAPTPGDAARAEADKPAGPTEEEQRAADEQRWRGRMAEARSQLERSKMFAEALQTRVNSLWADFTARDDPAQRGEIEDRAQEDARRDRQGQGRDRGPDQGGRRPRRRSAPCRRSARLAAVVRHRSSCAHAAARLPAPILIVEDKDSLRAMLRHALEAQGHAVVEARDEAEAVRLLPRVAARARPLGPAAARRATASACCAARRSSTPTCRSSS